MYIIGITGPTGAGKTIAMQALQKQGALVLDCDEVYHELLETNKALKKEITARFPNAAKESPITANNTTSNTPTKANNSAIISDQTTDSSAIDRKKLGKIVFGDTDALSDLNAITHKYVSAEIDKRISAFRNQGGSIAVINAIALFEAGYGKRCNVTVSILAPPETRISRIMERDGLSRADAQKRINAQQPDDFYIKNSNYTINNTFDNIDKIGDVLMDTLLIDKWFKEHTDEMIDDLRALVAINSVRGKSEPGAPFGQKPREALKLGQEMLEKRGFEVSVFNDMVISADFGPNPPKLGILTHLDIVDAGEHWDTDPFELTIRDGKLYGRGTMDNKGPAVATMYALYCMRDLFPNLGHGVRLIFGSSEETGFGDIAQYMKATAMPPNVFSPDADFPVINLEKGRFMTAFGAKWEKDTSTPRIISITGGKTPNIVPNKAEAVIEGICEYDAIYYCEEFTKKTGVELAVEKCDGSLVTITAKGTASHASRPNLGNNAQTALLSMFAAIPFAESKSFDYIKALSRLFPHGDYYGSAAGLAAEDEISGKTTVNFGVLRFDEYEFSAGFDARTAVCADAVDLPEVTRSLLGREGISTSYHELKRSHHTPKETEFVQTLLRVYEQQTGLPGECLSMGGLTYVHDIPGGVAFGCGMPGCSDENNVHGANEYIDVDQLVKCAIIFAHSIVEICGGGE